MCKSALLITSQILALSWSLFIEEDLKSISGLHGQLAQWLTPYLPVAPGGPADSSTVGLEYRQSEILNETSGTVLQWSIDQGNSSLQPTITFNLTTRLSTVASGHIILGLSRRGSVNGSDVVLVIGLLSGQSELIDMHGSDNATITRDTTQNWRLNEVIRPSAMENNSSFVSVILSRDLDTCDVDHDIPINNDTLHIIWGYTSSNLSTNASSDPLQFTPEGSVKAYIADPVRPNVTTTASNVQSWRISRSFQLPPRHTSYWCTIHKGITLQSRHHIIGYTAYFSNSTSESHVHHQVVYRCMAPPGMDPGLIFSQYETHPGEECYLEQSHQLPTHFCTELIHTWTVGGKPFVYPQNLGMSIGETQNEYFMFESHYDNPEMRSDITVENGVDFFYTPDIRPVEGGLIFLGSGVLGLSVIPPGASNFTIGGQCSSQCTTEMLNGLGGGGLDIMAASLHSHTTTYKMHVKHFRGGVELPWIVGDDNFDFTFQQMRHLHRPVKILPGDQIGVECVLNTTLRNGTTLSGFSTRDEMCTTFVIVNKRIGYLYCSSEYPTETTLNRYGIQNITWDRELQSRVINQANDTTFVGQTLKTVLDTRNLEVWTDERRRELQDEQLYGQHNSICPAVRKMGLLAYGAYFMEGVTAGLINIRERIEDNRPSTRTVGTPALEITSTQWPNVLMQYRPPSQCVL